MRVGAVGAALVAAMASGCLMTRTDARIRRGGQVALTSAIVHTPTAQTTNPDSSLRDIPPTNEASDWRGHVEASVAYGWRYVEFRVRMPFIRWAAGDDFPFEHSHVDGPKGGPLESMELFFQPLHHSGWFGGFGFETAAGGHVVLTRELTPRHAISGTFRALYLGQENTDDQGRRPRSAMIQLQASFTWSINHDLDLTVFGGFIRTHGPRAMRLRSQGSFTDRQGDSYVEADAIGIAGASINWH